jgi:hypothetical protein
VNRSDPVSEIFAEEPTFHGPMANDGLFAGPFGTEATERAFAVSARLPAADNSNAAREGTAANAADGSVATTLHAQRAARTERREVMTQTRPSWPGRRTLT